MSGELLLTKDAAAELGLSADTVRLLRRSGKMRSVRVGHVYAFERREVERLRRQRARAQRSRNERRQVTAEAGIADR